MGKVLGIRDLCLKRPKLWYVNIFLNMLVENNEIYIFSLTPVILLFRPGAALS